MKPACSGENPRSRVRYSTRKDRTIEPARLTSCEAATIHTGRGRWRRSFQYFNIGAPVGTGRAPPGFSKGPSASSQQARQSPGEQGEGPHEAEDVEKDREEGRVRGVVVRIGGRLRLRDVIHGGRGPRASARRRWRPCTPRRR